MNKYLTAAGAVIFLLSVALLVTAASGALTIGVKKGDWIEYNVIASGSFPGEHNAKWVRMEIMDVQGQIILVNVTTQLTDNSYIYYNETINFETGELLEGFFLPSNVTVGDSIYDSLVGNIVIDNVEQRTYAGASRTILQGIAPESIYLWDKATGMVVEAHSSYPTYNYTLDTVMYRTNMWQPQIFGLEQTVFYMVLAGTVLLIVLFVTVLLLLRRRKSP